MIITYWSRRSKLGRINIAVKCMFGKKSFAVRLKCVKEEMTIKV